MKKVIIYGYTSLGRKIVESLLLIKYKIIVADYDEKNCQLARKNGFEVYQSELLLDEELIEIGVKDDKLDAFYCVADDSNNNFFVTLSVRNLNKKVKIISKAQNEQNSKKMILAGATNILNPHKLGSLKIFRKIEKPMVSHLIYKLLFGNSNLDIEEFVIQKGSVLDKKYIDEFDFDERFNIIIIGIVDKELGDNLIFNYKVQRHKIDVGDIIVVIGDKHRLEQFNKYIRGTN